jgi:hypothetical protein
MFAESHLNYSLSALNLCLPCLTFALLSSHSISHCTDDHEEDFYYNEIEVVPCSGDSSGISSASQSPDHESIGESKDESLKALRNDLKCSKRTIRPRLRPLTLDTYPLVDHPYGQWPNSSKATCDVTNDWSCDLLTEARSSSTVACAPLPISCLTSKQVHNSTTVSIKHTRDLTSPIDYGPCKRLASAPITIPGVSLAHRSFISSRHKSQRPEDQFAVGSVQLHSPIFPRESFASFSSDLSSSSSVSSYSSSVSSGSVSLSEFGAHSPTLFGVSALSSPDCRSSTASPASSSADPIDFDTFATIATATAPTTTDDRTLTKRLKPIGRPPGSKNKTVQTRGRQTSSLLNDNQLRASSSASSTEPSLPLTTAIKNVSSITASNPITTNSTIVNGIGRRTYTRRALNANGKCRKKFGMQNRDQWCVQCRWKKACSRTAAGRALAAAAAAAAVVVSTAVYSSSALDQMTAH